MLTTAVQKLHIDRAPEWVYTTFEVNEAERNLIQRIRSLDKPGLMQVYVADGKPVSLMVLPTKIERLG
jgi:hypothetical protein